VVNLRRENHKLFSCKHAVHNRCYVRYHSDMNVKINYMFGLPICICNEGILMPKTEKERENMTTIKVNCTEKQTKKNKINGKRKVNISKGPPRRKCMKNNSDEEDSDEEFLGCLKRDYHDYLDGDCVFNETFCPTVLRDLVESCKEDKDDDELRNITITPTPISITSTEKKYKSRVKSKVKSVDCAICLTDCKLNNSNTSSICTLICGHVYHMKCIKKWLKSNESCPSCRKVVRCQKKTCNEFKSENILGGLVTPSSVICSNCMISANYTTEL